MSPPRSRCVGIAYDRSPQPTSSSLPAYASPMKELDEFLAFTYAERQRDLA